MWLLLAPCAHATLGRTVESVEADRAHFSARLTSTRAATHTVHVLSLPNGGVVREFTRPDGTVFAVSWRAPGRPDLRQLLGDGFETLQADNAAVAGRRLRGPLAVNRAELVVRTGGHPGAFWGTAYLPQQTPAAFSGRDLQATP